MATKDKKQKKVGFRDYINGVKIEMKKVVWPTKKEATSYTAVVIAHLDSG